jgi:hypothetical protein
MANVTKTPEKKRIRRALVNAALKTLEQQGWKVARVKGGGKGRVRRITKNGKSHLAVIRTSQDQFLAFPRNEDDTGWVTLDDMEYVVAASVDDVEAPKTALVHIFDASDIRDRFDRAYAARRKAGHKIPLGRGLWLSLYDDEATDPVTRIGAGAGAVHRPIARIPLDQVAGSEPPPRVPRSGAAAAEPDDDFQPLTIAEAKARLARTLGVDPGSIKITVEA